MVIGVVTIRPILDVAITPLFALKKVFQSKHSAILKSL